MAHDAGIYVYTGRMGSGKTYSIVADALELLKKGEVVYSVFPIYWNGYTEKPTLKQRLRAKLFGEKTKLRHYPKENFHEFDITKFWDIFPRLSNCNVLIDEAHLVFDSYDKMPLEERNAIMMCRKMNKRLFIATQLPSNLNKNVRSQAIEVYVLSKIRIPGFPLFRKTSVEVTSQGEVNTEAPVFGTETYIPSQEVFNAYNTLHTFAQYGDPINAQQLVEYREYPEPVAPKMTLKETHEQHRVGVV